MSLAALVIAVAAGTAAPGSEAPAHGVRIESAQARATIVRAVVVRQGSGLEEDREAPKPQLTRRGRTVLIEFE